MEIKLKERIEKHKSQSSHYFENALRFIEKGDAEKASEFLWGSVAQALKALAASKEIQLKSHRQLRDYATELTRQLKDESIKNTFDLAQSLHSNFYETGLLLEDVAVGAENVRATLAKIFRLIPVKESGHRE